MKKYPKFSVLMSVYKKENPTFLLQSIESIMHQTVQCDEFVIVKDGPLTSDLEKIIDNEHKKYSSIIKIINLERNVGLGNALNEGLRHCKYEYIARMDSDDASMPNRFEKQLTYIKNNPSVGILGTQIEEYDEAMHTVISKKIVPTDEIAIQEYSKKRNPLNHMTVIYKKEIIEALGGYKDCLYFEDYLLWITAIKNGIKINNLEDVLVKVRAGNAMIERRGGLKYVKCLINFEQKALRLHYISKKEFTINVLTRSIIAIMPSKIRAIIYKKELREK